VPGEQPKGNMGLWEAVAMAVGTMVGASIFAIFGVGARIAGRNLPEAFLLSGLYALIVAHSYAKLGRKIVSNAGPIAFILHGIGDNLVTGALSVLMWLTYVVSVAMFARGFAGYFLPLVHLDTGSFSTGAVVVAVVVVFTVLNFFGSKAVGRAEFTIVLIKVSILGVFVASGILSIKSSSILPSFDAGHVKGLLHASVLFFLSYMGFGLITNASENIENASKNVPRAIYISIAIVMVIYISVALVAVGNLPIPRLIELKENALAVAAEPFLGRLGFLLLSLGALFSISSALNATLYGGANISYSLAKDGQLPQVFERRVWFKSTEGLYITSALSILFGLFFDMNGIASMTSAIFTVIYIFVLVSHFRLADKVGGSRWVLAMNTAVLIVVFALLLYYQWVSRKTVLLGTVAVFSAALLLEAAYRLAKKRSFRLHRKGILKETGNS
jgi:amino acid transporter